MRYEQDLRTGERHRTTEDLRVVDGLLVETEILRGAGALSCARRSATGAAVRHPMVLSVKRLRR